MVLFAVGLAGLILFASNAAAHQPFLEEDDITASTPWPIADPAISTAIYATLDRPADVDYFTFEAAAGQQILIAMTIPQIEGQDDFAPTIALLGPGLTGEAATLPQRVVIESGWGSELIPPTEEGLPYFEQFGRRWYWDRQEVRLIMPQDGTYIAAVWSDQNEVGRYTFVMGQQEVRGGDPTFSSKIDDYWTPYQYRPAKTPKPQKRQRPLLAVNPEQFGNSHGVPEILRTIGPPRIPVWSTNTASAYPAGSI